MIFTAPAKVNLYLEVRRRREDGYHDIETVFERVSIFDEVSIAPACGSTTIKCDDPSIPTGEKSLMARAVSVFKEKSGVREHFSIGLKKNIPVSAGMGGGSSDTATILGGLNRITGSPLSPDTLAAIGGSLGADIPFFLSGSSFAYGTGRGDMVYPLSGRPEIWHVIVNPPFGVPTKDVYGKLSAFSLTKERSVDKIFSAFLRKNDIEGIAGNLRNDLQIIVLQEFPVLKQVFSALTEAGAKGVLLSGSGPTVFGIFDSETAKKAADDLGRVFRQEEGWRIFAVKTY
jgi:4-diphosphocytidyl-2-C-methyl-D-erythritol kinase